MLHTKKEPLLITGAAGFIGSQFIQSCLSQEMNLIYVDHPRHFETRVEHTRLPYQQIVDRAELSSFLASKPGKNPHRLAGIVHLGAISDTRESDPARLDEFNLNSSKKLWAYASEHQIPFVYASSAATYGDGAFGYDDNEKTIPSLRPLNLYGESKQKFDLWALDQERNGIHPPHWSGFKFFNVYGAGEIHKGFMSSVVLHSFKQIQKTGQVTLFKSHKQGIADGLQKRDFIYVEDVLKVLHFALEKPIRRGIFNLGTGQARAFLDLSKAVFQAMRRTENIVFVETPLAIRDKYQYFTEAKMEKLRSEGYSDPFTSLEAGIQNYVETLLQS